MHVLNNNIKLDNIHTLIITHSHSDHLYPNDFWCRCPGIANNIAEKPLHVYVTEPGFNESTNWMKANGVSPERVVLHKIKPFTSFEAEGYKFIPLKADHDARTQPVFYTIESKNQTILYAHDTGYFPEESWEFLKSYNRKFNFISLDCTGMLLPDYRSGHMGLSVCAEVKQKLTEMGLCDEKTIACINHFSHNGNATHAKLAEKAQKLGFLTSYDGFSVNF